MSYVGICPYCKKKYYFKREELTMNKCLQDMAKEKCKCKKKKEKP